MASQKVDPVGFTGFAVTAMNTGVDGLVYLGNPIYSQLKCRNIGDNPIAKFQSIICVGREGDTLLISASIGLSQIMGNLNSDLIPATDNVYRLGTASYRWSEIHAVLAYLDIIAQSLIPENDNALNLGSALYRWAGLYVANLYAGTLKQDLACDAGIKLDGVDLSEWRHPSDLTKLDGADIYNSAFLTDTMHGSRGGGTLHAVASALAAGFMSATDYSTLYSHKTRHQDGGLDEISVTGLSGLLADDQHVQDAEVTAVAVAKSILTEQGDIFYASAPSTPAALPHGSAGQALLSGGHGANPYWGPGLTESGELSNTPVSDTSELGITNRYYAFWTLPATYKWYMVTGIEWKNGSAVSGNVMCGVDIVNAVPPTLAPVVLVACGAQIAQSGTNAVQRNSQIASKVIRAGTIIGIWIHPSTTAGKYRLLAGSAQNDNKVIAYTADPANGDVTAWSAMGYNFYIKIYVRGIN